MKYPTLAGWLHRRGRPGKAPAVRFVEAAGAATTGDRGAILYTAIESCRRRRLDSYAYLKDVLTRLPTLTNHQVARITPASWAKNRPAPRTLAA